MGDAVLRVFELASVAGCAGHAELAGAVPRPRSRSAVLRHFSGVVAKIAVALELIRGERLVDVERRSALNQAYGIMCDP